MVTSPSVLCVVVSRLSFPLVHHSISCCQYFAPHCFHLPLVPSCFTVFSHLCLPHHRWLRALGCFIAPPGNRHVGPLRRFCLATFCSAAFRTPAFRFSTFRFAPVHFAAFRFPTFRFDALASSTSRLSLSRTLLCRIPLCCVLLCKFPPAMPSPLAPLHFLWAAASHSLCYIALHNHRSAAFNHLRSATFLLPPLATLSFHLFVASPLPI